MGIYEKYRENAAEQFQKIEYPAWKRIGWKDYKEPELPESKVSVSISSMEYLGKPEDLSADKIELFYDKLPSRKFGVHPKFLRFVEGYSNFQTLYYMKKGEVAKEPVFLSFDLTDTRTLADEHLIYAEKNSELTVVLDYHAEAGAADQYHIGLLKVIAEENANIKVFVIQSLPENKNHLFSAVAECAKNAKVSFYSVSMGGNVVASDYRSFLLGDSSSSDIEAIYLGEKDEKLDLSYNIQHYGAHSDSLIEVNGALSGNARKVFRGDLYFHKGARTATGRETEYVTLLSDSVRADSIPALFCDEDDVSGEHAANAGSIDQNKLFYIMNRGLSEEEAKRLIIRASFSGVLDKIPSQELTEKLEKELEGKLLHV